MIVRITMPCVSLMQGDRPMYPSCRPDCRGEKRSHSRMLL